MGDVLDTGLRADDIVYAFDNLVVVKVYVHPGELPGMLAAGAWEDALIQSVATTEKGLRITCIVIDKSLCKLHTALPFVTLYGMQDIQERLRIDDTA